MVAMLLPGLNFLTLEGCSYEALVETPLALAKDKRMLFEILPEDGDQEDQMEIKHMVELYKNNGKEPIIMWATPLINLTVFLLTLLELSLWLMKIGL
jgi:hypothetical protein